MFLSVVATLLLVHCTLIHGESHLVCKTMTDIFDPGNPSGGLGRGQFQGPPGKLGPQGEKGERGGIGQKGMKGDERVMNYTNVNSTMQAYLQQVFERLEALESEAMRTKQEVTTDPSPTTRITTTMVTTPQRPPSCPMWIGGSCFALVKDKHYNIEEAREVCSQRSSHLADITSKSTFDMLMNRIRSDYLGGSSVINMHLGMTITPSTGQVALSDGRNAPYLKWYTGHPTTTSSSTAMFLQVKADRMSTSQYFWSYTPSYRCYALCQMND